MRLKGPKNRFFKKKTKPIGRSELRNTAQFVIAKLGIYANLSMLQTNLQGIQKRILKNNWHARPQQLNFQHNVNVISPVKLVEICFMYATVTARVMCPQNKSKEILQQTPHFGVG